MEFHKQTINTYAGGGEHEVGTGEWGELLYPEENYVEVGGIVKRVGLLLTWESNLGSSKKPTVVLQKQVYFDAHVT